jgi:RHS repeat-associated protein
MQYLAPATTGDKGTGRLSQVQRPSLDPTTGAVNGTATTSVVYSVPVQGAGAPYDLSASTSAGWDQVDMPTDATAVFPANQPVASPPMKADISYLNSEGRVVNTATPGGQIQTTERDRFGNVVRALSAVNRLTALATGTTVAAHAARSHELDTQRTYSADGVDLLDELGPAHTVAGITPEARKHTTIAYDEGKPTATVYHLPTTRTVGARALGTTTDTDTRTTKTFYDWTLRLPIKTVVDPSGLAITTETKYDSATGLVTEQVMPRDTPSATTPKTAGTTQTTYYTAGATDIANCVNALWANLPCKTKPAVDPAPATAPKLPTTTYEYDESDHVTKETDTVGTVARVATTDYVNGRKSAENVTCTGCTAAEGTAIGQATYGYSATTGRLLTTTNALDNRVITRAYDALGRLTGYTDADGTTTTTKYDILDRPISVADGQGTRTFAYDDRGLTTQVTDTDLGSPGAIAGTYDADGNLTSQALPGGLNVVTTFDATDTPVRRCYIKATACSASAWMDFTAVQNVHGQQKSVQSAGVSSQNYTYDNAGRLTQTYDTVGGQCTVRTYGYDADSNRLTLNTKPPGSGGACSTAAGTTITHTYDTADRLIDSAYTYDTLGRITHVPGRDAGAPLDTGYYVNDLARSITQGSKTTTIDLDPNRRPRSRTMTPLATAELAHYADDTDEPSWTSKAGVTQRDIEGLDGDLAAVKTSGATATLQLINLHGDVVGEAPASTTPTAPSVKFETDEFGVPRPGRGPIFQVGTAKAALTTAGTSIAVAVPEGVQQGDLLLAMFALGNSADTTPTGWTAANANFTNGTTRYRLYYRIATATEPASYTFTISASGIHIASITALRNTATSAPAVTTAKNTSVDITAATITPASGDSAITVFAGQAVGDTNGGSVFDFPTPFTKTFEATSGTSLSAAAALRVLAGAAGVATGSITVTSQTGAGSAAWGAITAAIAPANPTPTQARYGYLGSKQRYTSTGAGVVEMGARLYVPQLGRFLQPDPVDGGSANAYDYAFQDPVNQTDLDGEIPERCIAIILAGCIWISGIGDGPGGGPPHIPEETPITEGGREPERPPGKPEPKKHHPHAWAVKPPPNYVRSPAPAKPLAHPSAPSHKPKKNPIYNLAV